MKTLYKTKIEDDLVIIYVSKLTRDWMFPNIIDTVKRALGDAHKNKAFIVQHIERETHVSNDELQRNFG